MNLARWQARIAVLLVLSASGATIAAVRADEPSAIKSIEAGREAFAEGSFPWYDSRTDALQALQFRDRPKGKLWNLGPLFSVLGWTVLALLLAALLALLYRFAGSRAARGAEAAAGGDVVLDADRVEALPFLAERNLHDLLGQARRHYEQGNYAEAIIYLFSYQLVQLDKYAVIHLAKGKTNRQYLRETARVAPLAAALERSMLAFEGVFFGRRALDRAGFEACWNGLAQFEEQLRSTP
jgi:hypothetical protein